MLELNKCHLGDNLELIKKVDDNSIDLCLFSPPYDGIRDYKKGSWDYNLPKLGKEISRILREGAICVMIIQDQTKDGRKTGTSFRTIIDWIDNTELDLWECCLYQRMGTPGAWWSKRFRVDHEYIPIFIKGKRPQYFNKEHMMVDTCQPGMKRKGGIYSSRTSKGELTEGRQTEVGAKKCCGTIIDYGAEKCRGNSKSTIKNQHPATFPDKFASDFIRAFTKEGMVVLDPFAGSGTTLVIAKELNRNFIGIEINQDYIDNIINKRLIG